MDYIDIVKCGCYVTLEKELLNGLNPNFSFEGVSLLHYAVVYNQQSIASLLIQWGADLDFTDQILHETALDMAISYKNYDLIAILSSVLIH